jgi:hypothetical protein
VLLLTWSLTKLSCKASYKEECFSQKKQENFLTFPSENVISALSVPSKLPDQLDASSMSYAPVMPSCPLPSAYCQEPMLPSCPSPSCLLPSASAIRARLELPFAKKTFPEELFGSFLFFCLQLVFLLLS